MGRDEQRSRKRLWGNTDDWRDGAMEEARDEVKYEGQSRPPLPSTLEAVAVTALTGGRQNFLRLLKQKGDFPKDIRTLRWLGGFTARSLHLRTAPVEMPHRGLWTRSARLTLLSLDTGCHHETLCLGRCTAWAPASSCH